VFCSFFVCLYICVCECLLQNNNHKTKHNTNTNCGSAFEPGASGLPYYCTSICVRSCCTWRASSVNFKPTKQKSSALLCFIKPILGNRYGAGVSSCQQTSDNNRGVAGSSPSTVTTSLAIPIPSSSSSNGPGNCVWCFVLLTRGWGRCEDVIELGFLANRLLLKRCIFEKVHSWTSNLGSWGRGTRKSTGTPPDYLANRADQKNEGPLFWKKCTTFFGQHDLRVIPEIEKSPVIER